MNYSYWEPGPRGMIDVSGVIVEWSRWRNKCVSMNGVCINTPNIASDDNTNGPHMFSIAGYNANMCQFRDIIIDKEKSFFHKICGTGTTGANLRSSGTIGTCGYASRTGGSTSDFNGSSNAQYQHGDLFGASHGMTKSRWYNGNNLISSQNAYGNGDSQYGSGYTSVSGYSIHFGILRHYRPPTRAAIIILLIHMVALYGQHYQPIITILIFNQIWCRTSKVVRCMLKDILLMDQEIVILLVS